MNNRYNYIFKFVYNNYSLVLLYYAISYSFLEKIVVCVSDSMSV